MKDPIALHINQEGGPYRLLLENRSDDELEKVRIVDVIVKNLGEKMRVAFDPLPKLEPRSRGAVRHQITMIRNQAWVPVDEDNLMYLTDAYSEGVEYKIQIYWRINGQTGHHQELKAGAGSGL